MATDGRKTIELTTADFETLTPIGEKRIEYCNTRKLFHIQNVGCISMWGDFTKIEFPLREYLLKLSSKQLEIEILADSLLEFLKKNIDATNNNDVGFHIGGYSSNGNPKLFHVFFGVDRGPTINPLNNPQEFKKYDHSNFVALYNGANDKAHLIINFILTLERELGIVKWITNYNVEVAKKFVELIIKQVSLIEPSVGEEILLAEINKRNEIEINGIKLNPLDYKNTEYIIPSGVGNSLPTGSVM